MDKVFRRGAKAAAEGASYRWQIVRVSDGVVLAFFTSMDAALERLANYGDAGTVRVEKRARGAKSEAAE